MQSNERALRKRDIRKSLKDPYNILNESGIEPFGPLNLSIQKNSGFLMDRQILNTIDRFDRKSSPIRVSRPRASM